MNYLTEINRFYDWLETNSLTDSQIALWHALMNINNKCGWKKEFPVAISILQNKTGLSKQSVIRSRNGLKQLGRIDFIARNGNQSTVYKIFAFHSGTQSGTQADTQADTQSGTQADTIHKLNYNETKLNLLLEKEAKENSIEILIDGNILETQQPPEEKIDDKPPSGFTAKGLNNKRKKVAPKKENSMTFEFIEFDNIDITKDEFEKLCDKNDRSIVEKAILYLSNYKIEKNYKTQSDYLTIIRWVIDAVKKQNKNGTTATRSNINPSFQFDQP